MMSSAEALAVVVAYENQGKLSGKQRDLLAQARKIVWEHAEQLLIRER